MHWNLKHSPNAKCSCFYLWGECLWFHSEMSHFVLIYAVSKCIWFVFIREFKVSFGGFVFVTVKRTIRSGKNKRNRRFIKMLNKDKAKMSPAMYNEEGLESWLRGNLGFQKLRLVLSVCDSIFTRPSCAAKPETKPFVPCDLHFVKSTKWFHDGI